jgi:hypothetical protein
MREPSSIAWATAKRYLDIPRYSPCSRPIAIRLELPQYRFYSLQVHRSRSKAVRDIEHNAERPVIIQLDEEVNLIAYITNRLQRGAAVSRSKSGLVSVQRLDNISPHLGHGGSSNVITECSSALRNPQDDPCMTIWKEIARTHVRNMEQ